MVIKITAVPERQGCYFTNETISVHFRFENIDREIKHSLMLATAQLTCVEHTNRKFILDEPRGVIVDETTKEKENDASSLENNNEHVSIAGLDSVNTMNSLETTRLKDRGIVGLRDMSYKSNAQGTSNDSIKRDVIFNSDLTILFCDVELKPLQTKECRFQVKIPREMHSTFRGRSLSYMYYVIVSCQRIHVNKEEISKFQKTEFKIPITIYGLEDVLKHHHEMEMKSSEGKNLYSKNHNSLCFSKNCSSSQLQPQHRNVYGDAEYCNPADTLDSYESIVSLSLHRLKQKALQTPESGVSPSTNHSSSSDISSTNENALNPISRDQDIVPKCIANDKERLQMRNSIISRLHQFALNYSPTPNVNMSKHIYKIATSNPMKHICNLIVHKRCFSFGDNIIILVDFNQRQQVTHKLSTYLKAEENINQSYNTEGPSTNLLQAKILNECHQNTRNSKYYTYSLSVPSSNVSFDNPRVALLHRLQFDFLIGTDDSLYYKSTGASSYIAESETRVRLLRWSLPIKLIPSLRPEPAHSLLDKNQSLTFLL